MKIKHKETVERIVDQFNESNLDYAFQCEIITGTGVVCEDDETVLCTAEGLYNFMTNDDEFDGVFTVENVTEHIEILQQI